MKEFEDASNVATTNIVQDEKGNFNKVQNEGEFDADLDEYAIMSFTFKKLRELVDVCVREVLRDD